MSLCTDTEIMLSQVKLQPFDTSHSQLIDGVVEIYTEYTGFADRYARHFVASFMERDGFVGLVAIHHEKVIGMSFGVRSKTGDWWHDKVAQQVNSHHAALEDAWVLTQLNVLEAYRGQGIGSLLHDTIIKQQPHPNLLLSTQKSNHLAQDFYQQHGWYILHAGFSFARGDEPYMIWAKTR